MSKIVYSACYGGFGLSRAAVLRYAELKNLTFYPEPFELDGKTFASLDDTYWTVPPSTDRRYSNETVFQPRDIPRADPALVQVVEEMGEAANGAHSNLLIAELDAGTLYRIDEYDGFESVATQASYDWSVA